MKNLKINKNIIRILVASFTIIIAYFISLALTFMIPKLIVLFLGSFFIFLSYVVYYVEKQRGNMKSGDYDIAIFKDGQDMEKHIK